MPDLHLRGCATYCPVQGFLTHCVKEAAAARMRIGLVRGKLATRPCERFFAPMPLAEDIERRIMRSYIQLIFQPGGRDRIRTVTVGRSKTLEIRLSELPRDHPLWDVPPFWLEVFSAADHSSIDGLGLFEFDDAEMKSAVELITNAMREGP